MATSVKRASLFNPATGSTTTVDVEAKKKKQVAAANRQLGIEQAAGINSSVSSRLGGTGNRSLNITAPAVTNKEGLTIKQANDPKYWSNGKFIGTPQPGTESASNAYNTPVPFPLGTQTNTGVTSVNPYTSYNNAIAALLKSAQGNAGSLNQDLLTQRNALITSRFNSQNDITPEQLRSLSPEQQAALRNQDVAGLDTQLGGVDAAMKAREAATSEARNYLKDFNDQYQKQFEPIEINGQIVQMNPDTGKYEVKFGGGTTDKLLSASDATALGVPYGTTVNQAAAMGITPGMLNGISTDQRKYLNVIQDNARQDPNIKNFADVRASYETAKSAATQPGGAGDIVLMRMLAKITDPSTGVREEEFNTFAGAQGTLAKFGISLTTGMWSGNRLSDYGRASLLKQAEDIYGQRRGAYDNSVQFYDKQATDAGLPSGMITAYYVAPEQKNTSTGGTSGSTSSSGFDVRSYISDARKTYSDKEILDDLIANGDYIPPANFSPDPKIILDQLEKGGFSNDLSTSKNGSKQLGMRTDRHNNPTAFTTDVAKEAGLKEGVDYKTGDSFGAGKLHTALLLGDPIATTIHVIDKLGFQTSSGKQRWSYINMPKSQWDKMSYAEKKTTIASMYRHEGGTALASLLNVG